MEHVVSDAAERNKGPILEILSRELPASRPCKVLEVGSGTGQHALFFAEKMPYLTWQPTDTGEYIAGLRARLSHNALPNLLPVIELDVRTNPWPVGPVDVVYSANTLHIMSWSSVLEFFRGIGSTLQGPTDVLCIYGPFRYRGGYTSDSNRAFDEFLRRRDPESGIRDFEAVDELARQQGLHLSADHAMPANNQLLVWRRAVAG